MTPEATTLVLDADMRMDFLPGGAPAIADRRAFVIYLLLRRIGIMRISSIPKA
jgi:hypothetical protein